MSDQEEVVEETRGPRSRRGKRILENRKPKIDEDPRQTLFIRGPKSSDEVRTFLKQIVLYLPYQSFLVRIEETFFCFIFS